MDMAQYDVLEANFQNMKDNFEELKKEVKDIVPQITKMLKEDYVTRTEFSPYKNRTDWITV